MVLNRQTLEEAKREARMQLENLKALIREQVFGVSAESHPKVYKLRESEYEKIEKFVLDFCSQNNGNVPVQVALNQFEFSEAIEFV